MAKNRLNLNFDLVTNAERADFVETYLQSPIFTEKPPTQTELETIANYILWGRNTSGKNDVQEKQIQIATKHGTWDNAHDTESLDALIESPTFNEAQLTPNPTHYIKKAEKFSRDEALKNASPELKVQFQELFRRIDWLDLQIELYELTHAKRTKPIREQLLKKFTAAEQQLAQEKADDWTSYHYLKQRHELVELRREQYTLRDSFSNPILRHTVAPATQTDKKLDWDADILVRPLGLIGPNSKIIFRDYDYLNPKFFTEPELKLTSDYYWSYQDAPDQKFMFDFRDLECVYQLFLAFFDMEDAGAAENVEGNAKQLLATLNYYINLAELTDLHREILDLKIKQIRNQDIANYVNKKYEKNYTANYISTIFRQKIIPQINAAAQNHEDIIAKIYFPEEFKTCTCCGRTYLKTADFFVRKARSKDGLSGRCKKCDKRDRDEKKVIELVQRKN